MFVGSGNGYLYCLDIATGAYGRSATRTDPVLSAGDATSSTDEDSDSTNYTVAEAAAALTQSGSIVFIDPATSDLVSYYQPLAVNGGTVEQASLRTFVFPLMRQAILGTP